MEIAFKVEDNRHGQMLVGDLHFRFRSFLGNDINTAEEIMTKTAIARMEESIKIMKERLRR